MAETRLIEISPVTRVEGHGKVTIHLDENNQVDEARLHIVEFRGALLHKSCEGFIL